MIVLKYGGSVLTGPSADLQIIDEIVELHGAGEKVAIVHGGAPAINRELAIHKVETIMENGFRVTDEETMQIVQRTLSGEVLRNLVNQFIARGVNAVGVSSSDGKLIRGRRMEQDHLGNKVNLGLVGEIVEVNPTFLNLLLDNGYLPIISPVGTSVSGEALNINGDVITGAIGGALTGSKVIYVTDVSGIYRKWPDKSSLIKQMTFTELNLLLDDLAGGMIPKVKSLLAALSGGAESVRIVSGSEPHAITRALRDEIGTLVVHG
jgi:acetylglutamate kinase